MIQKNNRNRTSEWMLLLPLRLFVVISGKFASSRNCTIIVLALGSQPRDLLCLYDSATIIIKQTSVKTGRWREKKLTQVVSTLQKNWLQFLLWCHFMSWFPSSHIFTANLDHIICMLCDYVYVFAFWWYSRFAPTPKIPTGHNPFVSTHFLESNNALVFTNGWACMLCAQFLCGDRMTKKIPKKCSDFPRTHPVAMNKI